MAIPKLPDKPTPDQLKQITLTLIRYELENDAQDIGDIEPTNTGWKTTYTAGGVRYTVESDRGFLLKQPVAA